MLMNCTKIKNTIYIEKALLELQHNLNMFYVLWYFQIWRFTNAVFHKNTLATLS